MHIYGGRRIVRVIALRGHCIVTTTRSLQCVNVPYAYDYGAQGARAIVFSIWRRRARAALLYESGTRIYYLTFQTQRRQI
eukprot:3255036-Lingulodinium_polyedra.AAC.1